MASLLAQRYTPPFRHELPGTMAEMLARESWPEKVSQNCRLLRRWIWRQWNIPSNLVRDRLPPAPARLLWVHYSSRSIGDAIMELAGRTLLENYHLELLANRQHLELFASDPYFKRAFSNPEQLDEEQYDFVLLDIWNTRSLAFKRRVCPHLPCASLQGFFYGAVYNQVLFSCYRIHHLLGYPHEQERLRRYLRPRLFVETEPCPLPPKGKSQRIALMLGGVYAFKTYQHWPDVLRRLQDQWPLDRPVPEFVLVGSSNGQGLVEPALQACSRFEATSCVGALTLRQTARVLSTCDFFLGTDGGLMHCADALGVRGVALFGNIPPHLRLAPDSGMHTLFDTEAVSNIPSARVAEAILSVLFSP